MFRISLARLCASISSREVPSIPSSGTAVTASTEVDPTATGHTCAVNHLGNMLPPEVSSALIEIAKEKQFTSSKWYTDANLASAGCPIDHTDPDAPKPVYIQHHGATVLFYNADQVRIYQPVSLNNIPFAGSLKAKFTSAYRQSFSTIKSPLWVSANQVDRLGATVKATATAVVHQGSSRNNGVIQYNTFFNLDDLENTEALLREFEVEKSLPPSVKFHSKDGSYYSPKVSREMSKFLRANNISQPSLLFATSNFYTKNGVSLSPGALPFSFLSKEGEIIELYNAVYCEDCAKMEEIARSLKSKKYYSDSKSTRKSKSYGDPQEDLH